MKFPHLFSSITSMVELRGAAGVSARRYPEVGVKTILLADDDDRVREVVALTLGAGDFAILQAVDGQMALNSAITNNPALLLLDVDMPEMDGFQVCRALKRHPHARGIKVIMLTAKGAPEDQERALLAGADGFFSKPFSPIALLNKVYEVFEQHGDDHTLG